MMLLSTDKVVAWLIGRLKQINSCINRTSS
jgi:hypothetical protein